MKNWRNVGIGGGLSKCQAVQVGCWSLPVLGSVVVHDLRIASGCCQRCVEIVWAFLQINVERFISAEQAHKLGDDREDIMVDCDGKSC